MPLINEYAQLALLVYNVDPENKVAIASGWSQVEYFPDNSVGFSYGVYSKGNEIVISFTGTNEGVDWLANGGSGTGIGSDQLNQAALVATRIIDQYKGTGKTISFTGHSLGGGLASVMAIWFNRGAVVFDEAPFLNSAISPIAYNAAQNYVTANSTIYNAELQNFSSLDYPARSNNVSDYFTTGEALQILRSTVPAIGSQYNIDFGNSPLNGFEFADAVDLHAQTLMVAGMMSLPFRNATSLVTNFLPAAFDSRLYSNDRKTATKDFLSKLIQSEQTHLGAGNLTRLTTDLVTFGGSQAGLSGMAKDTVVAQMVEWYQWQDAGYNGQFFSGDTASSGMLQYSTAKGDKLSGAENKANAWASVWLENYFDAQKATKGLQNALVAEQWNVVNNSSSSNATAVNGNKKQVLIGNSGGDTFTGGEQDDVVVGAEGNDELITLGGNDMLFGGAGQDRLEGGDSYDEYFVDAQDSIMDSDGSGSVTLDDQKLSLAKRKKARHYIKTTRGTPSCMTKGASN